jgi:hypothetical protein
MSVLDRIRRLGDRPDPPVKVTEREAAARLYGWRRTIDVAPRTPPARTHAGYDQGPADEQSVEPREPDA